MDSIFLALAAAMIAIGLIMLLIGVGLLIYGIWLRHRPETPPPNPTPALTPNSPTEAQQQ